MSVSQNFDLLKICLKILPSKKFFGNKTSKYSGANLITICGMCLGTMGEQILESISFGEHHTAPLNRDDQLAIGRSRVRRLKPLDEPEAVAASSNSRVLNRSSASKAAQRLKRPAAARLSTSKKRRTNGVD